ncbi:hypothetical protein [Promicromonospora sp. NPDC090134]|uniref:hypothetical protein n=1 Tax=Promicromonospora sp. NPDC090134 TaxID=3364408 RepID=UPI00380BEEAB
MNDDVTPSAAPAPSEHGARAHAETTPLVPALASDAGLGSALVAGLLVTFAMSLLIPLGLVAAHGDGVDPSVLTRVVTLDILLTIATLTAAAVALGSLRLLTAASLVTAGGIVMEAVLLGIPLASGSEVPRIGHIALLMLIACPLALWWIAIRRSIVARRWLLLGFVLAVPAATYLPAIVMAVLYVRLDLLANYLGMVLGIVAAGLVGMPHRGTRWAAAGTFALLAVMLARQVPLSLDGSATESVQVVITVTRVLVVSGAAVFAAMAARRTSERWLVRSEVPRVVQR